MSFASSSGDVVYEAGQLGLAMVGWKLAEEQILGLIFHINLALAV